MKVLLAASEVAPIIKLGGLGDVIGSLPKALEKIGVNVDVIVPYFPIAKLPPGAYKSLDLDIPFDGRTVVVEIYKTKLPDSDVDVFLIKNDDYFASGGVNAFADNISETEMFAFFDRAVVEFLKSQFNTYDIVHCNDWHTGLITHIIHDEIPETGPRTLFTIHNLMYQGIGDAMIAKEVGFTPGSHRLIDWDLTDGQINLMLQGITSSDYLNAVSPTYAQEILTKEFGSDLAEILKAREGRLSGIINGIDYSQFPRYYDVSNWKVEKHKAKRKLQKKLGLKEDDKPLYAFISRLDANQKGLDILIQAIPEVLAAGGQFVLLGKGDPVWEQKFRDLLPVSSLAVGSPESAENLPNVDLSINVIFDTKLAEEIYSAADFLIVPSKYEPCGLIQMIAMWYGTLPIVHAVGGLKDSVNNGLNGFTYNKQSKDDLLSSIMRSFKTYGTDNFDLMVQNAMRSDFSWNKSAIAYKELYEKILA